MEKQSKLADLRLVAKYFPVSNYSYPRPHTPCQQREDTEETRDRASFGSDSSVPGMVEDHGSDVSVEDEYQYHTTGAQLWDSFWKANPQQRLSRMRSYPALIKLPTGHCGYNHPEVHAQKQQQQQRRADQDHPKTSTSNNTDKEVGESIRPLPPHGERRRSQTPVAKKSNASWSVFPQAANEPAGHAIPPRSSSRLSPWPPLTPSPHPSAPRKSAHGGHPSTSSIASSSRSRTSTGTSAGTTSTAPSPPPSAPISPPALLPSPFQREPAALHHPARPSLSRAAKKRPSLGNLRKLGTTIATLTTSITRSPQDCHHPNSLSEPLPRRPHLQVKTQAYPPISNPSTPTTPLPLAPSRPAPPIPTTTATPAPLVSVFEYDSDSDSDAGGGSDSDDSESESASSSRRLPIARRIVRGLAHRGRHHHHHNHNHQGGLDPRRPRSASEGRRRSGGDEVTTRDERTRAGTVGAPVRLTVPGEGWREGNASHAGLPVLRRQKSDVFGRMLGRMSR